MRESQGVFYPNQQGVENHRRYVSTSSPADSFIPVGLDEPTLRSYLIRGCYGEDNPFENFLQLYLGNIPTPVESTVGDQFAGMYNDQGISRVTIGRYARILDHLQYGWAIPEPASATLSGAATALLLARRRRDNSVA